MATEASSDWSTPVKFTVAGELWPSIEYGKLLASDGTADDWFGAACALNALGDIALISSRRADVGAFNTGCIYVFTRSGTTWTQQQKLVANDREAGDEFGTGCALNAAGDLALIGAYSDDNNQGLNSGSVYVFTRSGNVWTQQQKLVASDGIAGDGFGHAMALNADATIALIGTVSDDTVAVNAGSFYYFTRSGSVWTQVSKIYASDAAQNDSFGVSCALNATGDLALIGAYGDNNTTGSTYVFTRIGAVWTEQQKLLASDGVSPAGFGVSIALNADATIALIGADRDIAKGTDSGSVYVFTRSGSVWTQKQKLLASDGTTEDWFGIAVALNAVGDLALIGAALDDDKGLDSGSVYMFS